MAMSTSKSARLFSSTRKESGCVADFLPLSRRPPFAGLLAPVGPISTGVDVSERNGLSLSIVQARKGRAQALTERVENLFGLTLPDGPTRAAAGAIAFLGMGRERWLTVTETDGASFTNDLAENLGGLASVIEQTDGLALLRISGPRARATFAKGLPIDLHPAAFAVGAVATTHLAHIGVTIWAVDDVPTFDVALFRSFAGSFWHWLSGAAAEFGLSVGGQG
jgi:methylglutamate dehydrogenase subunit D